MIKKFDLNDDGDELRNFKFNYNIQERDKINHAYQNKNKIDINDLRRISLWKLNRILDVPDSFLEKLNQIKNFENLKFSDEIVLDLIEEFQNSDEIRGIGFPMLSSILKFIKPDVFPIIDVRAYRALFAEKINYSQYNKDKYFKYVEKVYEIKDKLEMNLEEIDEKLYEFDKKHNGKIS